MNFEQFLTEGINDNFLYHNTSLIRLEKIIDSGELIGYNNFISFSRSKHYRSAPGTFDNAEVRFVFDRKILNQRRKIESHADLSVSSGNWQDDKTIKGAASRWESEEQVKGPIPITKQYGLIAIEVLKSVIDKHVKYPVKVREEMIKKYVEEKIPKVKEGYFWNDVKKDWDIIFTSGQKKRHNLEKYRQNIEKIKQEIEEYKTFPDKIPNLKIVNSF